MQTASTSGSVLVTTRRVLFAATYFRKSSIRCIASVNKDIWQKGKYLKGKIVFLVKKKKENTKVLIALDKC